MPRLQTLLSASLAAAAMLFGATTLASTPAHADRAGTVRITNADGAREARLGMNKSMMIELSEDAKDIIVTNPAIANAVVRSARRIFVLGVAVGSTNIFFFDAGGRQIGSVNVVVERDLEPLNRTLRRLYPNTTIRAEAVGENVIVSGQVASAGDAKTVIEIAERFVGQIGSVAGTTSNVGNAASGGAGGGIAAAAGAASGSASSNGSRIVNALTIAGRDQVMLRVVVAEMDRRVIKQLGVDLEGSWGIGTSVVNFATTNPFPVNPLSNGVGRPGTDIGVQIPGRFQTNINLRALEQTGIVRTLAEPSLTAISGESANFLAGGEFPVPVARDRDGNILLQYKQFGVGLSFTPVVLSEGRISLRTRTEVSEIDSNAGYTGPGGFVIPGLNVRRAESTLELPSGGTIVMAGLIRDQAKRAASGVPALRRLPILGRLFSSQDFLTQQTELVVLITPVIVNPVARRDLSLPTDGFVNASDPEAAIFGRLNRQFGSRTQQPPAQRPHGRFGFIYE